MDIENTVGKDTAPLSLFAQLANEIHLIAYFVGMIDHHFKIACVGWIESAMNVRGGDKWKTTE